MKNHWAISSLTLIASTLLLSGCGGGSSSSPNQLTGQFLDSPVANMGYSTPTQEGTTNDNGEFTYLEGEEVTFFIGGVEFPPVDAASTVTPLEIAGSDDVSDNAVVNIARLLQTLDDDENPENGITIPAAAVTAANGLSATAFSFSDDPSVFENDANVMGLIQGVDEERSLVPTETAMKHFKQELTLRGKQPYTGLWFVDQGETNFGLLALLEAETGSGTYYHGYADTSDNGEAAAAYGEYGSFTVNGDSLVYTNTVSSITQNGMPQGNVPFRLIDDSAKLILIPPGDLENSVDPLELTRISAEYGEIYGMWQRIPAEGDDQETVLFVFTDDRDSSATEDHRFIAFQPGLTNDEGSVGMEYGTYTYDASNNNLNLNITRSNGGDSMFSGIVINSASVQNNVLTIEVSKDGETSIERFARK